MPASPATPIGYHLRIYRREQLWLPAGLWSLFVLLVAFMGDEPGRAYEMASAFLGIVLPLSAGFLAASAIVDDAALELQLAAPRAPWRLLAERLALLLAIAAVAAVAFQICLLPLGVDLAALGGLLRRQLVWLVPSLALMGLSSLTALAFVQGTGGALFAGVVWSMQLLLSDWFMGSRWARYIFLFLASRRPHSPDLLANQLCLVTLTALLLAGAALMLKKEERYL